jgi:1,3-beta-glucanosyltransferase GAS1
MVESVSHMNTGLIEEVGLNVTPRKGYWSLSSQLAMLQPSSNQMNNYSPSKITIPCTEFTLKGGIDTYPTALSGEMKINSSLPVKPNSRLCSYMMQTMNCITNSNTTMEERINSHKRLCLEDISFCSGVGFNSTKGQYDSFLMCNETQKASWAYQKNYIAHGNDSAACSSVGGMVQRVMPFTSLQSDCQVLLRQAGPDGKGTITFDPSTTATESGSLILSAKYALESRAKIGIGVSISVFVILCAALRVYLWVRRWRIRATPGSPVPRLMGIRK